MTTDRSDRPAHDRFHGRIPGSRPCAHPGCTAAGEFRAPGFRRSNADGPGDYRWLCLDHVRAFNASFNYFSGMTADEIAAAQTPFGGWERETRAFGTGAIGADLPPKWADFADPLDAMNAHFRDRAADAKTDRAHPRVSPERRRAYAALQLEPDADRHAVRKAYSRLVRQYHPDRNGGDRRFERQLQDVLAAYALLKS